MVLRWREVLAAGHACPKVLVCFLFINLFFTHPVDYSFPHDSRAKTGLTGGDYVFHMAVDSEMVWDGSLAGMLKGTEKALLAVPLCVATLH